MTNSRVSANQNPLRLGSITNSMLPIYVALIAGVVLATALDSRLAQLAGLAIIGTSLLLARVVDVKRALLTVIIVEIPLQLDIFLDHDPLVLASVSGFNISATTLCLGGLYTIWAMESLASWPRDRQRNASILWAVGPAFVYFAVVLASLLGSENRVLAIYQINVLAQALLLLIYIVHWARARQDILFLLVLLALGLTAQTLIAVAQEVGSLAFELGPIKGTPIDGRATGTLRHGNRLGSVVALLMGPSLGLALAKGVGANYRALGGVAFTLGLLVLPFSRSRGAWLAASVGIAFAIFFAYRRGWINKRLILAGALALSVVLLTQSEVIGARLEGGVADDPNVIGRVRLMELSLKMVQENPLLGVGANNFGQTLPEVLSADFSGIWLAPVHNKYLSVAAETGIIGLIAFAYLLGTFVRRSWKLYSLNDDFAAPLGLGFLAGFTAILIHMNFDKFTERVDVHILWLFMGIGFAAARVFRQLENQDDHVEQKSTI